MSDPIILEFVLGMAVALAYRSGVRMPPAMAFLLVAAAIAEFAWYTSAPSTEIPRWIGYGSPAVQTVAAFALIDRTFSFRVVEKLGDASYALYLIHRFIEKPATERCWRTLLNITSSRPGDSCGSIPVNECSRPRLA